MKLKDFKLPRNYWKLGATGRFPRGSAARDDEGELRMALVADHQHGVVRLEFGKKIAWLGMAAGDARELAAVLIEKADELDKRKM